MRKFVLWLMCFLLAAGSAQAAQLISGTETLIPGAVAPAAVSSFTGSLTADYMLDNDPHTCWSRIQSGSMNTVDIMLTPAHPTVAAIWMRSGNQASQWEYEAYSRPSVVKVVLSHLQGNALLSSTYRYAITDVYAPDTNSLLWRDGYQCLQLPEVFTNVQSISITVEQEILGSSIQRLCIADILLSDRFPTQEQEKPSQSATFQPIETTLSMRLATRSGPSTGYDELGSYFKAGHSVKVLSLCYDNGGVPWVQVEFTYKNRLRRAYTGLKRVNVDEVRLPREEWLADAVVLHQLTPRFGPGTSYEARNLTLEAGQYGSVYAYENGWAQFEYFDNAAQLLRRVWVPTDELNIY